MKTFRIEVKQVTDDENLDHDDREENPSGEYFYNAHNEDHALDRFHSSIPISCLDDFEINVEECKE